MLSFGHPEANHNGGWIGFSPRTGDNHNLYIATGDGGSENDQGIGQIEPGGNAQNNTTLLGKMLRIHVNPTAGTASIPSHNPFFGSSTLRQEIWAFGLRNPFRASFDRGTGQMFIGDVGKARVKKSTSSKQLIPVAVRITNGGCAKEKSPRQPPVSAGLDHPAAWIQSLITRTRPGNV